MRIFGAGRLTCTLGVALALAMSGLAAPAIARSGHDGVKRAVVLHPKFRRVNGSRLLSDGQYTFVYGSPYAAGTGVLTNGRTGQQHKVSLPGCGPSALGGPWLAFSCDANPSTFQLYNITTRQVQRLTATVPYQDCVIDCLPIVAVGTHWVAFEAQPGDPHTLPTFAYQNLITGQVSDDPSSATQTTDLDSPGLVKRVCPSLRVPGVSTVYASGWGSLTFDAGFAIASGTGGAYLERCGSHLHQLLTFTVPNYNTGLDCPHLDCPPATNSHEIIWQSAATRLTGIFLADRQQFTIHVPAKVDPGGVPGGFANGHMYQLALTSTRLYLLTPGGEIWSIPAPTRPGSTSRHHG